MKELIQAILIKDGWRVSDGSAIAVKDFDTAVGTKEAHAYLTKGDGINRTIYGDYQTEGCKQFRIILTNIPI